MKRTTVLAIAASAALAMVALFSAASASATVLCKSAPVNNVCPAGDRYGVGTEIKASLKTGTKFVMKNGFANFECESANLNAVITNAGSASQPVTAQVTDRTVWNCLGSVELTVEEKGVLVFNWKSGTHDAAVTQKGVRVKIKYGGTTCYYGGESTEKMSLLGGGAPRIEQLASPIQRLAGSGYLCASPAQWSSQFDVTSPTGLFVEQQ